MISFDETKGQEDKGRGINVVVLHQATGAVLTTASFDVYSAESDSQSLETFIDMTTDGRIMCFLSKVKHFFFIFSVLWARGP